MADLKLGTQIGGNLVWHQGILDLNPVDTKLYFQDQEVLVDTGYQTLKGTMKFNVPANQYDIESVSNLPTGSKSMLRKFRGGINDTIWHETIQSDAYRISRGTTDTDLVMQLTGTGATFQGSVLTNAAQSSAANSFTRKDFVNSEDAKKVNKAGDGMTGNLDFNLNSQGIRVNFPGGSISTNTGIMGGQGDGASRTKTNMQIKSWWGVGFSPSGDGTAVSPGDNSIWFDTRNGNMYTIGRMHVGSDQEVYSPLNKPTPGDINAYTKSEVDEKGWFRVKDERAAMIAPNALQSKTVAAYFTNQSDVTTNWVSGFTVNGWESTYAAWSLFSSARSDADDARLWFKYGRTAWSPSYRIYHENNKPTNVELNLVSRAGDVMTGALDMKVPDSLGFGKYAIKLNDGSIGGINQLVFGDPSDTSSEGILFPKSGKNDQSTLATDYDALYAFDGVLKFNGKAAYGEWNKPTSADTNSLYVELTSTSVDLNTLGGITDANNSSAGVYRQESNANATTANHYPVGLAGTLLVTPSAYGCHQEYTTFTGRKFHRGLSGTFTGTGPWGEWTEFYSEVSPKQFVDKTGDTMTGALIATQFKASSDYGFVRSTNDAQGMFVGADGRTIIGGGTGALILRPQGISNAAGESVFNNDGTIAISKTGTADNHLVTKKYVDDKVGTAVQSVTATGAVKSTGGINPVISLANATNAADGAMSFADKAKLDGIPAAAVNRTGDTMTGVLAVAANAQIGASANGAFGSSSITGLLNSFIEVVTPNSAEGNSAGGIVFHNRGTSTSALYYKNDNSNDGYFNFKSDDLRYDVRVNGNKVYHQGFKPTPADVGALPVTGGTVSGVLGVTAILDLVGSSADDMADIVWRAPDGTERGRLWIGGTLGVDNSLTWRCSAGGATHKIYHEGNKPTAADVGALSIAGGEMGGVVAFRGSANLLNVVDGAKIRYFNGNSAWFHTSVNAAGEFEVSTGGVGETSIATIDYSGKIRTSNQGVLYGDRSKPTASDVGAAPAGFGLGEYGRGIGSVLGDTPLRRQSGFFQGSNIAGIPNTGWTYLFNQAHGNAAGYFGYLAINFAGTQAWIGGQEGGAQKGPFELVKQGDRFVANKAGGNDYNQCAIEVNGNTAIDSRPGIGFHMAGRFASTLHLWEGGDFRFHAQGLTSYAAIMTGNVNANDVYIRSDIRLKRNLVRVTGALDKTCSLTAYSYDKKQTLQSTDYDKHEVGLIAQDVEKVLPAAISYIEDSDAETGATTLMISNSAVTALLVEAIKELTDRVKYLESKIN